MEEKEVVITPPKIEVVAECEPESIAESPPAPDALGDGSDVSAKIEALTALVESLVPFVVSEVDTKQQATIKANLQAVRESGFGNQSID